MSETPNAPAGKPSFRQRVNRYSAVLSVLAIAAFAAAVFNIVSHARRDLPPPPVEQAYYFDLTAGVLFSGPINAIPPIVAPGAKPEARPTGALAHVYACGSCEAGEQFIGYIELYSGDAHRVLTDFIASRQKLGMTLPEAVEFTLAAHESVPEIQKEHHVGVPDKANPAATVFVGIATPQGQKVLESVNARCPGEKPAVPCSPASGPARLAP